LKSAARTSVAIASEVGELTEKRLNSRRLLTGWRKSVRRTDRVCELIASKLT